MNAPELRSSFLSVTAWLLSGLGAWSAEPAAPTPVVTDFVPLPEVVVEEKRAGPPALYGEVPGFQVLSLNSEKETREFVREVQRQHYLWGLVVPEEMQTKHSVPLLLVLAPLPLGNGRTHPQETINAIRTGAPVAALPAGVQRSSSTIAFDTDDLALFLTGNVINPPWGSASHSCLGVEYLLQHHTPQWPQWLTAVINGVLVSSEFTKNSIRIMGGHSNDSADSIAFPPFEDLFGPTAPSLGRPPGRPAPPILPARPADPRGLTQKSRILFLFFRWVLTGDKARVQAFWKFASRTAAEPASEKMLQECLGIDYAALQAELRKLHPRLERLDYDKPLAQFKAPTMPEFPDIKLHPATRAELVRTKSAWERLLAIRPGNLGNLSAEERALCLDQAGRRLERAYEAGERDPQFLAERALWACETGDDVMAGRYLEEAAQAKVVHPRVYWELAYRRYLAARAQPQEPDQRLSRTQVAWVMEPLAIARTQSPSQAMVYAVLADLWSHSAARPSAAELAVLSEYVQLFPSGVGTSENSPCSIKIALLNAREGKTESEVQKIDARLKTMVDGSQIIKMRPLLNRGRPPARPGPTGVAPQNPSSQENLPVSP